MLDRQIGDLTMAEIFKAVSPHNSVEKIEQVKVVRTVDVTDNEKALIEQYGGKLPNESLRLEIIDKEIAAIQEKKTDLQQKEADLQTKRTSVLIEAKKVILRKSDVKQGVEKEIVFK
jgi:hypothetical protein